MGLMRNLGQFIGHIAAGFRTDASRGAAGTGGAGATGSAGESGDRRQRRETNRRVEQREESDGVILRRTIIEEVEMPAPRTGESNDHAS